jgi:hypothetical protein
VVVCRNGEAETVGRYGSAPETVVAVTLFPWHDCDQDGVIKAQCDG